MWQYLKSPHVGQKIRPLRRPLYSVGQTHYDRKPLSLLLRRLAPVATSCQWQCFLQLLLWNSRFMKLLQGNGAENEYYEWSISGGWFFIYMYRETQLLGMGYIVSYMLHGHFWLHRYMCMNITPAWTTSMKMQHLPLCFYFFSSFFLFHIFRAFPAAMYTHTLFRKYKCIPYASDDRHCFRRT